MPELKKIIEDGQIMSYWLDPVSGMMVITDVTLNWRRYEPTNDNE